MSPLPPRRFETLTRPLAWVKGLMGTALGQPRQKITGASPICRSADNIARAGTGGSSGCTRILGPLLVLLAAGWLTPASAATGTCGAAGSQGVNGPADYSTYCWIDFTNYNNATATSAGGQAFTITLPGGSTLSFTLNVSGPALTSTTVPTWTGAALGQSAFITIPGKPALYQTTGAGTTNVTLSNIVLTVGSGTVPYAIVAADAESTNNGENLNFTTNGNAWTLLASMAYSGSTTFPTLSGVGTATVTETGVAGNVGAYAFATQGSPTTISSSFTGSGLQGIALAVKFHAVDFAITSSHTGSFTAGSTGSYTLTATNNGPDQYSPTDTVTVTDTLPTGETYVSASGSGWSCGAVGQVVTCTSSNVTVNSGSSLPAITLNVSVAANAAASLTNTATVASNPNLDYNTANNTATDVTAINVPDFSTSTKTVANTGGGDAVVGSTLQYTITLTESAGVAAVGASVTDDVPANLTNFTVVSYPSGATNSSTSSGGANGDGQLNITGINVPANGSVTVVFTAQVKSGTANCTNIDNTATITTPNGSVGATPSSSTITIAQSSCASAGGKILYLYDNTGATYTNLLNRVVQTTNTGTGITVNFNSNHVWNMSPTVATGKSLVLTAGTVTVSLIETNTGNNTGTARPTTVSLLNNGAVVATSASVNVASATAAVVTYTITVPTTTVAAGTALGIRFNNNSTNNNRNILISQKTATLTSSRVSFVTSTVINVDSVTAYNATYPATTTTSVYPPSQTGKTVTVYICAVISDPFGSYDVTSANISITDPNGTTQVSGAAMTLNGGGSKNCAGTANAAVNSFEYAYTLPIGGATGFWTASVTGHEGTEGTITHTANGSFDVDLPSLLVMKSVSVVSDPAEGTTRPKAIPGATILYTVMVQNNGRGPTDTGMTITDPVPTNTVFYVSSATPFTFSDGGTTGLSAPTMSFSNTGGTSWSYVPTCLRPPTPSPPCSDPAINDIMLTFTGSSMIGKIGSTTPAFTITYQVILQ